MENCMYVEVSNAGKDLSHNNVEKEDSLALKYILRQILISSTIWTHFFVQGLCLGSPTVIIPQIRREANSSSIISQEMASWLSSSYNYSGMVQVIILAILPRYFGRKHCCLIISALAMCGFIFFYLSETITQLIISAIVLGAVTANNKTISVLVLTEYSVPQYRGMFLTTKSASFLWGIWVSNTIGTFFHWKYIPVVGCITTGYSLLTVLIWPESPLWLASKGRFNESVKAHHWLKGDCPASVKEIDHLVKYYTNNQKSKKSSLSKTIRILCKKGFYKPLLLSILLSLLSNSLGKMTCTVYAFDILKTITSSESTAYKCILVLDGVTIIGAYIGCIVSKFVKRRSFIILTSAVGITFLYLVSCFMFLVKLNIVKDNMYISIGLLSLYSLAVSSGPIIMTSSLISEFIPVFHRNMFSVIIGVVRNFLFATYLKTALSLFSSLHYSGSFLFYAMMSTIFLILIYILLPETKDKTLLEIENLLTNKKKTRTLRTTF